MDAESLVFDIDGTLWDSRPLVAAAYRSCLKRMGVPHVPITDELLGQLFGKVREALADAILPLVPAPRRYGIMSRCIDEELNYMAQQPCRCGYPGVAETLKTLSERHRLFIVSNSEKGYPELCMEKLGISPFFSGAMCYGDTGTPKGQTILHLTEHFGIRSAAYIGDTQGDCDAAREAGLPFVWAAYGFGVPSGYDAKIDCISRLTALF